MIGRHATERRDDRPVGDDRRRRCLADPQPAGAAQRAVAGDDRGALRGARPARRRSGGDVKTMEERGRNQTVEDRAEGLRRAHRLPLLLRTIPKVVIASINGPVAGAGLGLALACDLRIAGRAARFGTAFARIGYSGDYGGSWTLTRLVGTARARELYFLADVIDAETAFAYGMVNRLVDDEKLREETALLARRIADGPRIALGYMKKNLLAAETEPFQTVLDLEAAHQARCAFTEDHKEAVAAFVEKRRPVFKGR